MFSLLNNPYEWIKYILIKSGVLILFGQQIWKLINFSFKQNKYLLLKISPFYYKNKSPHTKCVYKIVILVLLLITKRDMLSSVTCSNNVTKYVYKTSTSFNNLFLLVFLGQKYFLSIIRCKIYWCGVIHFIEFIMFNNFNRYFIIIYIWFVETDVSCAFRQKKNVIKL